MLLFGTIVNIATIVLGSLIGVTLHSKLPKRITKIVFQAIGIFTIYLGITMAFKSSEILIMIFSMVIGASLGEWIDLDKYVNQLSGWVKRKTKSKQETFSNGLISAFLLFCIGSMTILGAIEEGTQGNSDLLIAKAVIDGFSSIALASALGLGVMFSIFPLFIFQGGLTLLAYWLGDLMPEAVINEMTAVGGLLLMLLGFSIMEIKIIKVVNMLPALVVAVVLAYIFI